MRKVDELLQSSDPFKTDDNRVYKGDESQIKPLNNAYILDVVDDVTEESKTAIKKILAERFLIASPGKVFEKIYMYHLP